MPHARVWRAAEVRALGSVEHDEAVNALRRLTELNSSLQAHSAQIDDIELTMGELLAAALDGDWARAVYGKTTGEWASENLRGRDGSPLGEDAARNLARDWRAISQFPAVEAFVRSGAVVGTKRVTCRTAAYFACETAILSEWLKEAVEKKLTLMKEVTPGNVERAKVEAEGEVNRRILDILRKRSATQIRDDFYAFKKELNKQGDKAKEIEWVSFKGSVPREVADQFEEALRRICEFADDDLDPDEASMTQKIERVAGWANDAFEAFEAAVNGNDGPIKSILVQARERLK